MRPTFHTVLAALLLVALGCGNDQEAQAIDVDQSDEMLAAIDAVKLPIQDPARLEDEAYIAQLKKDFKVVLDEKGALIEEFHRQYPGHKRTAPLLNAYWENHMGTDFEADKAVGLFARMQAIGENTSNVDVVRNAVYWTAFYRSYLDRTDAEKIMVNGVEFANLYPNDARAAALFYFAAVSEGADEEITLAAYQILAGRYGETQEGQYAQAILPLVPNLGRDFQFEFEDAVTGRKLSSSSLRGKVIVVDFWATWCPPCLEALPDMLAVYEEYKVRGVEFIGVNMDVPEENGGLRDLLDFVKVYEVPWPQYYLKGEPGFSDGYSVTQLPTVFIVDQRGVIRSVDGFRSLTRTLDSLLDA